MSKELIERIADAISYDLGDTFIDFNEMTPYEQWLRIVDMIYSYGAEIRLKED